MGREMMSGLQAVEEQDAEFANMLGVRLVVLQAAREAASAGEKLAGGGVVAMRLFAAEGVVGDFLEDAVADADGGNEPCSGR